jgi:3-oxoacyl-[acyl-carrier protein] reductase|tara:strand:- start:246 stop:1016 length:771 start_codon:yes stop_codon:yes gene_type:complete
MNLNLKDKVFIISGSSRGIGKEIARVLLEEDARIILTGRDHKSLSSTFDEFDSKYSGKVLKYAGDLNDEKILRGVKELVLGHWKRVDGVIANAGAHKKVENGDISGADWQWYFSANFGVARRFVSCFIPEIKKTKGSIIFISSIAGVDDIGAPLPFSASKAALNMYAKGLSRELASNGVRVNTIAPGNIMFEGGNWDKKQKANPETIERMLDEKVALKRFGKPEEIGNLAAFLLSDKAAFITGSCYVADGGQISSF